MHIRIDHQRVLDRAVKLEVANRHSHVVDRAEAFAVVRASVVKAAADIGRPAVCQRSLPRQNRTARRQPHRLHQFLRIRNLQTQSFAIAQRALS